MIGNIVIFGAGGFGREVRTIISDKSKSKEYNFIGYFDDGFETGSDVDNGYKVLGGINDLLHHEEVNVIIAIGEPSLKKNIYNKLKKNTNLKFPTIIHPSVKLMGEDIKIGMGSIITAGVILTCNIVLGEFVILNLSSTVGHDTIVGNYSSVMPGVNISGEVIIKEGVYVGTGSTIINRVTVNEYSILGAGCVVSRDIPANCTAVGIPAKPIKFHEK